MLTLINLLTDYESFLWISFHYNLYICILIMKIYLHQHMDTELAIADKSSSLILCQHASSFLLT